ncbi:hypothetical protein F4819DRAFT_227080 [Hypoxylon fuscum]|nr:hypothetical protein F4819DRAFT_227080 [Hypoxylon fuscum]
MLGWLAAGRQAVLRPNNQGGWWLVVARRGILYVYRLALTGDNEEHMAKILAHEIGHILGLRHEFAGVKETGSMLWGEPNAKSVMNYFPCAASWSAVQRQDIKEVKDFYALPEHFIVTGEVDEMPISNNGAPRTVREMKVLSITPCYFQFEGESVGRLWRNMLSQGLRLVLSI